MRSVVVLSGGMDSATALYKVINDADSSSPQAVHALSLDYRQRHVKELAFAAGLCATLGIRHTTALAFFTTTKAAIVREGSGYSRTVSYDRTWSCYLGRDLHCGRCGTCVERREAFALAGVQDPTAYEREDV